MCVPLDRRTAIPDFQARIKAATTKEEMLDASMAFVQFFGGFSDSPESRQKFIESIQPSSL